MVLMDRKDINSNKAKTNVTINFMDINVSFPTSATNIWGLFEFESPIDGDRRFCHLTCSKLDMKPFKIFKEM